MVAVNACIIHEVLKDPKSEDKTSTAKLDLSEELLDNDNEFVSQLLFDIHKSFGDDSGLRNTHFEKDKSTVFSTTLSNYLNKKTHGDFFDFSKKSIRELKGLIEKENFASGGYYVFGDYLFEGRRFISVMVVRKNKNAINFTKVGKSHRPSGTEIIDTDKIAMGFRLNFNLFETATGEESTPEKERNYIALLAGQQDRQLSGYFKDWVNAAGIISNEKNSTSFVDVIKNIDLPVDQDGNTLCTREELKRKAYTYAEESRNKVIDINAFSAYIYGDDQTDRIMKFAVTKGITIDPEFRRSSTIFKKLITIHAKVPGIELNIDYDRINSDEVDVRTSSVVIKSKQLVEQINRQKA